MQLVISLLTLSGTLVVQPELNTITKPFTKAQSLP